MYYILIYHFQNDCLTAAVKYRKTYYQDRDITPKEDLFFTITLFPLTTIDQKIDKKEYFGGSMTISSLGGIGGGFFTPIVNLPEVCILGIGKTEIRQIYIDGKFMPRKMMPISLSYDHRMIDGAEAARFCQDLKVSMGRNFAFKLAS